MYFIIFISIILVVCLALLLRLIWRRLPELRTLDVSAIPQEKQDDTKIKILEVKFLRQKKTTEEKLGHIITPLKRSFSFWSEGLKHRVATLEKKYKRQETVLEARTKSINELLADAKAQSEAEDYASAEKNLIEVIARDKKNLQAYELLAKIYRQNKSYDQAEEILCYLIKLKSLKYRKRGKAENLKKEKLEDAEAELLQAVDIDSDLSKYYDDLAKIYELLDKKDRALDCYLKANTVLPNNPKFLDKIIDLAIGINDSGLAKKTYRRLKEINPANAKLEQFAEALEKMK